MQGTGSACILVWNNINTEYSMGNVGTTVDVTDPQYGVVILLSSVGTLVT